MTRRSRKSVEIKKKKKKPVGTKRTELRDENVKTTVASGF